MSEEPVRGVHLTDKQIVFTVMAGTVVAVVVFLCGVFVGRGVLALRPALPDAGVTDSAVVPDTSVPIAESETGGASAGDAGGVINAPEKLTYYDRVRQAQLPAESLAGLTESGPPVPPPDAPEGGSTNSASPAGLIGTNAPAGAAAPKSAPPAVSASAAGQPPAATNATAVPDGASPYTVQVFAVRRLEEAQALVDRLKKKGFPAFVFTPPPGDTQGGFKVRVGSFKSRQEAAAMASRLQKEKYSPWIIR